MKKKLVLSLTLLSLSSITLAASLTSMSGTQVKKAITDKTITSISDTTLNGKLVENSFIGYFNKNGTVDAKFANPLPDGAPQTDQGTWKIATNGQLCVTWKNWDNAKPRCVTFYKLKNAMIVVGPENIFETLFLDIKIQDGNQIPA